VGGKGESWGLYEKSVGWANGWCRTDQGRGLEAKLAAVPGCELKCIFFPPFSISSLRANRGRLDYQSRAASGTFFSVEHVGRRVRKGSTSPGSLLDGTLVHIVRTGWWKLSGPNRASRAHADSLGFNVD